MLEISTFVFYNCPGRLRVRTTGEALTFGLICPTMLKHRESKTLPAKIEFAPSPFSSVRHHLWSLCWDYVCTIQLPGAEWINDY